MCITSPITQAEHDARQRAANHARHSSELEGAMTPAAFKADVDEYVNGEIDTDEVRRRIRVRHGLV